MGCKVKIQKIERAANKTYYVNFPAAFADAVNLRKGEEMEWLIEGRNCFVLRRVDEAPSFIERGDGSHAATDSEGSGKRRGRANRKAQGDA